jgi:prepilin-type N-terminal cleavage/methylation domain-containing protein
MHRVRSPAERGFSLTELMVVITLVAVLAAIGVASFRKEVNASKSSEVMGVIQAIRSAQEAYRAERQEYLDVSTGVNNWYPVATYGSTAIAWPATYGSHTDGVRFRALAAPVSGLVQFRYLVDAGSAGATLPTPIVSMPAWPAVAEPWYVIQARADVDSDNVYSNAIATSFSPGVYLNNEGE